jgi:hypothetical protein
VVAFDTITNAAGAASTATTYDTITKAAGAAVEPVIMSVSLGADVSGIEPYTAVPLTATTVNGGGATLVIEQVGGDDAPISGTAPNWTYVAPAVLESFGLAALEARGVGLPVVGRLGTGLADFIEDGLDGLLCAGDTEMVAALVSLVNDEALRGRMSERNRTVEHVMSWTRSLDTHERIYSLARGRRLEAVPKP